MSLKGEANTIANWLVLVAAIATGIIVANIVSGAFGI